MTIGRGGRSGPVVGRGGRSGPKIGKGAGVGIGLGFSAYVEEGVLSNNISNLLGGSDTVQGTNLVACPFYGEGYTVEQVTLMLKAASDEGPPSAQMAIFSDVPSVTPVPGRALTKPGIPVGFMTSPESFELLGLFPVPTVFTGSERPVSLISGEKFWVVLKALNGTFNWGWTNDENGVGIIGFVAEYAYSADDGVTWTSYLNSPELMKVEGSLIEESPL